MHRQIVPRVGSTGKGATIRHVLTVAGFLDALGRRAPLEKAAAWDPVGLQLGDASARVERVALCHEVTEDVVARLEQAPVDLLVSYHPLLFRATNTLLSGATPEGRTLRLARRGTALAVVHTSFDIAEGGTSDALAEVLGLVELSGFAPLYGPDVLKVVTFLPAEAAPPVLQAVSAAGAGRIGNYSSCSYRSEGVGTFFAGAGTQPSMGSQGQLNEEREVRLEFVVPRSREAEALGALVAAHPYEEPAYDVYERRGNAGMLGRIGTAAAGTTLQGLAQRAAEELRTKTLRLAGDPERILERVAVIPGSGAPQLGLAAAAGADTVVTGDLDHHAARAAQDRGLCLLDAGHVPTERPGLERLYVALGALGAETLSFLDLDPDPWAAPS